MPETKSPPRRIMLTMTDRLASALRSLGLDPDDGGESGRGGGPCGAIQVTSALCRYASAIESARRRLAKVLDRAEWNYLADVMNGCLDLHDYAETSLSLDLLMMANAQDGHALNGTGYNHFGREEADARVEALVRKLAKMTPIEADAVAYAIRGFWADPEIDATADEWWLAKRPRAAR